MRKIIATAVIVLAIGSHQVSLATWEKLTICARTGIRPPERRMSRRHDIEQA